MIQQTSAVEQIKQRLDLVEFIRQYVPHLRKAGKTWKACCPFHQEKTPSFIIDPDKNLFYCFGCQTGGDIFDFLMKIERISFQEALQKLADMAGVEYKPQPAGLSAADQQRLQARKLLELAKNFYHKNLMSAGAEAARTYIKNRGLTKQTAQKFQLGLATNDWTALCKTLQAQHFSAQQLKQAGLCAVTSYGPRDYFRNRLMFPIWNQRSEMVGFGGRILGEGEPKYLNSPETLLFNKSHVLYGLNFAGPAIRKENRAVLLEGYMDVIACHQAGFEYTVAPLGTSFTPEHAKLLKRYTDTVVILFDPDAAGIKAALRAAFILLEQGLFVQIASLSDGLDPDEYIARYGNEKFKQVLDRAEDLIAFHTRLQLQQYPQPLSAQAKTAIINELTETILKQPDQIIRQEWVKYIAEQVKVEEPLVLQRLQTKAKTAVRMQKRFQKVLPGAPQQAVETFLAAEENLISWLLKFPQYAAGCEPLAAQFDSQRLGQLLRAICQAAAQNPDPTGFTQRVCALVPEQTTHAIRLSVAQLPKDFQVQRDIDACKKTIEKEMLQRQLSAVRQQIKTAGTGQVPAALLQQMTQLQNKLKNK